MDNFKMACHEMTANAYISADSQKVRTLELNDQKAGMTGLDKDRINKIIYDISKGTPYFLYQQKRQQRIDDRIREVMMCSQNISENEKLIAKKKLDILAAKMEAERKHCHIIVHFDMDAFFAAVEIRDNPELQNKAVAVGSNYMLSTSNYEARKFGVRAAMPGFIAKKLCPHLIIVPVNYDKYRKVSNDVFNILRNYDPDFLPMSLDEAYVDLSDYMHKLCIQHKTSSQQINTCCWEISKEFDFARDMIDRVVNEIRGKIFESTGLTASAGIGPNMMLAKICSDRNKPNGQFRIPPGNEEIKNFISVLPVRKISGIGPVQEQILRSLGITICQHLWEKRAILALLFTPTTSNFYLRVALGLGYSELKSDSERKSKGVESTFQALSTVEHLYEKCHQLCMELCMDLKDSHVKGKVLVLKIKTVDYNVHTRNMSLLCHTSDVEVIFKAAKSLLDSEIASYQPHPLQLRLMGVRMCNLIDENSLENGRKIQQPTILHSLKTLEKQNIYHSKVSTSAFICPVCNQSQPTKDLEIFNAHLDECLNKDKQTEAEITEEIDCLVFENENYPSKKEDEHIVRNTDINNFQQPQSYSSSFHLDKTYENEISGINDSGIYSETSCYEFSDNINDTEFDCLKNEIDTCDIHQNNYHHSPSDSVYLTKITNDSTNTIDHSANIEQMEADSSKMVCPICSNSSSQDLHQLNQHIDICLNKPIVKELLSQPVADNGEKRKQLSSQSSQSAKKLKTVDKSCRKIKDFFVSIDNNN